jgi:predicted CopG family antitoxin
MHDGLMRTTIEISDDTLRKLRELAASRGERGYSRIIEEALGVYFGASLRGPGDNRTREERLRALEGSISDEEAEELKEKIRESRRRWRTH